MRVSHAAGKLHAGENGNSNFTCLFFCTCTHMCVCVFLCFVFVCVTVCMHAILYVRVICRRRIGVGGTGAIVFTQMFMQFNMHTCACVCVCVCVCDCVHACVCICVPHAEGELILEAGALVCLHICTYMCLC